MALARSGASSTERASPSLAAPWSASCARWAWPVGSGDAAGARRILGRWPTGHGTLWTGPSVRQRPTSCGWPTSPTWPPWSGFAYVAFVTDVFSRLIVGWRVATTLSADLALDALEMAIWFRKEEELPELVHHSDRGVQYLSIRYTERLAEVGAASSVGSRGDSYDNALAESIFGLYKSELITLQGPWRTVEDVEFATLSWVHWWNNARLHSAIGDIPPAEFEAAHYASLATAGTAG